MTPWEQISEFIRGHVKMHERLPSRDEWPVELLQRRDLVETAYRCLDSLRLHMTERGFIETLAEHGIGGARTDPERPHDSNEGERSYDSAERGLLRCSMSC